MTKDIESIEVLSPGTSYELSTVKVNNAGYEVVGGTVIRLATGSPNKPEIPRKEGVRIDSLIRMLLINVAERTVGDISVVTTEDVKAVKAFMLNQIRKHESSQS